MLSKTPASFQFTTANPFVCATGSNQIFSSDATSVRDNSAKLLTFGTVTPVFQYTQVVFTLPDTPARLIIVTQKLPRK